MHASIVIADIINDYCMFAIILKAFNITTYLIFKAHLGIGTTKILHL